MTPETRYWLAFMYGVVFANVARVLVDLAVDWWRARAQREAKRYRPHHGGWP